MSNKKIVLCLDGTWNGPGETDDHGNIVASNVQKLFERLAGTKPLLPDEAEFEIAYADNAGTTIQVSKYLHGVGDSSNILTKYSEGSTGAGLLARVVRGYTFLSRNYQAGDSIVIVGFSRGAYSARAVAGLVASQGLLDWRQMGLGDGGDPVAYAAGMTAWSQYKRLKSNDAGFVARLVDFVEDARATMLDASNHEVTPIYLPNVPIDAVAVWDTVGAMGVPLSIKSDGTRPDLFEFADNVLSDKVKSGFHAISIDEERADFTPSIWFQRSGITQVLFPGAHADVGGGYPKEHGQSGLSDGALKWMLKSLQDIVQFKPWNDVTPDPAGPMHRPWTKGIYRILSQTPRLFKEDPKNPWNLTVHQGAIARMSRATVVVEDERDCPYRPASLGGLYFTSEWKPMRGINIEI